MKTKHDMGEKFHGVLFDIDGVLEFQGKAYPGAVELLEFLRKKGITYPDFIQQHLKKPEGLYRKIASRDSA